jgi:ADP-ribose pyrophosphatase YjhB (NUDIX family)
MGEMADYYYELSLMEEAIDDAESARTKVIKDLFNRIGAIFNNPALDHRDKFKKYQSSMQAWILSANSETSLEWRQTVQSQLYANAKSLSPEGFRNMNNVSFVHWPKMYEQRCWAIQQAFYAWSRTLRIDGLSKIWRKAKPEPSPYELPPGVYNVQLSQMTGKRADFVILDDLSSMGQAIYGDPNFAGAVTGRWTSTDAQNEQLAKEAAMLYKNVKIVSVSFYGDARTYDYFTQDMALREGDKVVVDGAGKIQVAEVREVYEFNGKDSKARKWVIQKVDFAAYEERLDKMKQALEIKKALDAAVERDRAMITYEKIAEGNAEVRELLDKFKALGL